MNILTRWLVKLIVGRLENFLGDQPGLSDNPSVIADTLDSYGVNVWAHVILADLGHALYSVIAGKESLLAVICHVIVLLAGLAIIWSRHAVSRNNGKLQSLADQLAAKTGVRIDVSGGSSQETGVRSQNGTGGQGASRQNFTSGTSSNILPLLLAGLLGSAFILPPSSFAADPTAAAVAVPAQATNPSWMTALANAALEYCTTNHNFVPTSGPGGTVNNLRQAKVSAVVAESLTVWDNGSTNYNFKLDVAHATCIGDGKTHEGLGIDLRYIGQLPPSWKLHLPVLGKLGTFHTLAGIAPDLDAAVVGRFGQKTTVCWFGFGLGGE